MGWWAKWNKTEHRKTENLVTFSFSYQMSLVEFILWAVSSSRFEEHSGEQSFSSLIVGSGGEVRQYTNKQNDFK